MAFTKGLCPMTERQLVDEFFIENRTRVLEVAAFLDRLDRAMVKETRPDFRTQSLRQALAVLCSPNARRVEEIQRIFSDPSIELKETLDRKSAHGAYDHRQAEE